MADAPLGEFELVVILAVLHLIERHEPPFGSGVLEEIRGRAGRTVARGAVYVTLDRLEGKGLLASRLAGGPASRGGRPRRLYRATVRGLAAVKGVALEVVEVTDPVLGNDYLKVGTFEVGFISCAPKTTNIVWPRSKGVTRGEKGSDPFFTRKNKHLSQFMVGLIWRNDRRAAAAYPLGGNAPRRLPPWTRR